MAMPNQDTDIGHMPPNPNTMNPLPTAHGYTPTGGLHPRKADEATPTQRKLHTQPCSKHPHHTARRDGKARAPRNATPAPPTGATGQTPLSTEPTTEPPTPHQDGTKSPCKRSPASGKHSGSTSPTTPPQPHRHTTSLPLKR
ncbi:hypothetical protein CRENBAI_018565 [Crenichthys baileyi]|uniref:Uncharacterized protein n=1 Tax=Crenichthys baileyi TaxID=28760 RepID=A0AAV9RCU6_9TELE